MRLLNIASSLCYAGLSSCDLGDRVAGSTTVCNRTGSIALLSLLLTACPSDAPTPIEATPAEPAPSGAAPVEAAEAPQEAPAGPVLVRLLVEPDTLLLGEGMASALQVSALTAEGATVAPEVTWRSLSPSRISVSPTGVVTSVGPRGPGFVTASAGDLVVEIPVRVVAPSELPPEPEEPEEGSASAPEPVVVVRGAEADPAVDVEVATAALIGTWQTTEIDGSQRIVTFHDGGRLLDERRRPNPLGDDRGQRRLGRWQLQVVETTRMRLDFVYDDAQFGRDALLCEPPTEAVLDCGPTVLRRRS